MFKRRGRLYVVSGPSGVGKGSLVKKLLEKRAAHLSVSCTSRLPREGEVEGESYYFISKDEFKEKIQREDFLEWAEVYGNYYGTPKAQIEEHLSQGRDVILEIEMLGSAQIKQKDPNAISIFVMPPSLEVLRARLISRGTESDKAIEHRLSCTMKEMDHLPSYDYYILNEDLELATDKLIAIMEAEAVRVDDDFLSYLHDIGREFSL